MKVKHEHATIPIITWYLYATSLVNGSTSKNSQSTNVEGKAKKTQSIKNIMIAKTTKIGFVQNGFLNGYATRNEQHVIIYWKFVSINKTVSSYETILCL